MDKEETYGKSSPNLDNDIGNEKHQRARNH